MLVFVVMYESGSGGEGPAFTLPVIRKAHVGRLPFDHLFNRRSFRVRCKEPRVFTHDRQRRVANQVELRRKPLLFLDQLLALWIRHVALPAIQLGIEYDPAPPFDAGHPDKAPDAAVTLMVQRNAAAHKAMQEGLRNLTIPGESGRPEGMSELNAGAA